MSTVIEGFDLPSILWAGARTSGWRGANERYVAMPNAAGVRQLIPWRWSSVAATTRRSSDDRQLAKRIRDTVGVVGLLTVGALDRSRRVGIDGEALADRVAARLGDDPARALVLCGPPRANQKPVIQLHDRRGRTVAFVKVAWNDLTRRLLDDERRSLDHLARRAEGVRVPKVLATGDFGSATWMAISPVEVDRRRDAEPASIDEVARAIEATGEAWDGPAGEARFARELLAASEELPRTRGVVAPLFERDRTAMLSLAGSHGDFVPWNIQSGEPMPAVWDWERYRTACPIGYDRLHHRLQVALHRTDRPFPEALRDLARSTPDVLSDLPDEQRARHLDWYLVDLLARYEHDLSDHPAPLLPQLVGDLHDFLQERLRP